MLTVTKWQTKHFDAKETLYTSWWFATNVITKADDKVVSTVIENKKHNVWASV
jgi:hypothetical protein